MVFDSGEIKGILPHREPFLFIDEITEFEPEKKAVGLKRFTGEEDFFRGHFPGRPVLPGVIILEAMAQVGGIIIKRMDFAKDRMAVLAGSDNVKFRSIIIPGDVLIITAELITIKGKFGKIKARTEVNGKVAAEGELLFSLVE